MGLTETIACFIRDSGLIDWPELGFEKVFNVFS
jgi:hypothetical protein